MHNNFIPEHPLAVCADIRPDSPMIDLTEEQAVSLLRKEDVGGLSLPVGLHWMGYNGMGLGWVKSLGNRINNYYPKEWRIRKR
jgi:NOL1/NOP2/fmu family ribosome biogenesis protein